jgi:hypothetical protein
MNAHQWSPEIRRRAEKAVADLESFYDTMQAGTPLDRRQHVHRFALTRMAVIEASGADPSVVDKVAGLDAVCKQLSLLQPLAELDEGQTVVHGLGLVAGVRIQMHTMGLVQHDSRVGA